MDYNKGIFIHNQTKYLSKAGCQVEVISPVPYSHKILWLNPRWKTLNLIPTDEVIEGVNISYPRYLRSPGAWFHGISCYTIYWGIQTNLHSIMREFRPDIIHAHTATVDGYVGLLFKKKYGLPLICSLRGSDINIYPYRDKLTMLLTKRVISEAEQIICVSHALKIVAETIAKPKRTIEVVYNGCDLQTFSFNEQLRIQYRAKIGIAPEERAILFIGSIEKNKGIFELINSFIKLNPIYSNLHLIILGNGPEYTTIKRIISFNDLGKKIHFLGKRPHNEISHWLNAADIFVLPTYYEGFPNVIFEAMACGLPVLATRVGGIPEIVTEATGILIPTKNTEKLTEGIEFMLSRKWNRKTIRKHVENFTWERNAEKTIQIYKEVMSHWRC